MTETESPYRVTAYIISSTCGHNISAGGVWNVMQRLGERNSEEEYSVKQIDANQTEGKREIPVLFEEMDAEKEKQGWSILVEKTMLAGMDFFRTINVE